MRPATRLIESTLKKHDIKCGSQEIGDMSFVQLSIQGKNLTVHFRLFSLNDTNAVILKANGICTFPKEKIESGCALINHLNYKYGLVKFVIDPDDGEVFVGVDFPPDITNDIVGELALKLILLCTRFIDEAYPELMKFIWA